MRPKVALCARVVSLKDNGGSQDVPRKPAVLFVCLGNICRSPLAEAAFRAEVVRIGQPASRKPPDPFFFVVMCCSLADRSLR